MSEAGTLEHRLDELEIKLAFVEKELEEYKEASRGFYRKMNELEEEILKLQRDAAAVGTPIPEVSWDGENREIRP